MLYSNLNALTSVVAIGGGHGLGRVMSSLSFLESRLTGIVTTTDNGSSTGRIRAQQGGIAWGDIRNCLMQLNDTPSTAAAIFEYRFQGEGELSGHNLGNLIFRALEDLHIRPFESIKLVRNFLRVSANLIPMSELPVHIAAKMPEGETVVGEVNIDQLDQAPSELFLLPQVPATREAISAVKTTPLILLGPGSFFTSILPPLLVCDLSHAIAQSNANIVFIDNLGTEHSPAAQLSLHKRIAWIEHLIQRPIQGIITHQDAVLTGLDSKVIMAKQLNDSDVYYRHDRTLLCRYLDQILTAL
ncbi:uridine diphosphate-N-acetylglucosamine-binding protein YvcK [Spirabiliibacterium falconis]|uniref:uridine diphosphate-N-acetylglucosamine-binding protein YvcK n=1 Tax=Spirabiliibacterium falconis TaxID=572023 RepID=UPI001AAC6121|nr:uridine diphosphate-N-acetylglucosamine-binding protein YvcK [Spirabiliibacterium falconis]MBE2894234.1 uridine diphosphate-N-acetylglucosamine-binding protein YvcK [Spirabiliibacterium falconis]